MRGLWYAVGIWVKDGLGMGKLSADWMTDGRTAIDRSRIDLQPIIELTHRPATTSRDIVFGGRCMKDEQAPSERHPDDGPEDDLRLSDLGKFTRRGVLVGAASSVVASQALGAARGYVDVNYGDSARKSLVISWIEGPRGPSGGIFDWRLSSTTFAEEGSSSTRGRFALRRTTDGWLADLTGCSFPGGYAFDLRINVGWDPNNPKPSLSFSMLVGGKYIVLRQADLIGFLKSRPTKDAKPQPDEIGGIPDKSQLSELAKRLFGATFEVGKAKDVTLAFHRGGYWILRAGEKLADGTIESAASAANRFSALSGEGVALRFREIAFSIFSGTAGGGGGGFFGRDRSREGGCARAVLGGRCPARAAR